MTEKPRPEKRSTEVLVATRAGEKPDDAVLTIGIDLGTSTTCASVVKQGKPMVIPARYGSNTIPSVLTLDENGKVLVGEAAAKRMILSPERTVFGSKRLVGRTYSKELVEKYQPHFPYPIVETQGHRFGASLEGTVIAMEDVATHILSEIRAVAETHLGTRVPRAVITVPAYFSEIQRDFVRQAGKASGLEVARIVNEPTAAAVAYGFHRNQTARIVVFDLGGGTFDVSILDVSAKRFQVVGTGGDDFLGGFDFDERLAQHLWTSFVARERIEVEPTPQQLARLREAAETAKRSLSVQTRVQVQVPQFCQVKEQYRDLGAVLTREEVETLCKDLMDRVMAITSEVLTAAKVDKNSIDEVLLVGGSTRMPIIQDRVTEFFGRKPSRGINPDEAVAIGAALLASEPDDSKMTLIDVLPLSIGFAGQGRRFMRLIPRNTPVPTERTFVMSTTTENQTECTQHLFQGERNDAARNEYLGSIVIESIPPGPANRRNIELALSLDEQGRLKLRARDKLATKELGVRLDRTCSLATIEQALGPAAGESQQALPAKTEKKGFFGWLRGLFGG